MRWSLLSLASLGFLLVACGDDIPSNDDSNPDTDTDGTTTSSTTLPSTSSTTTTTSGSSSTTLDPATGSSTTDDPTTTTNPTGSSSSSGSSSSGSSSSGSSDSSSSDSSSSTGPALEPEIDVSFDATAVADGASFDIAETVDVGSTGTAVVVTVENTGTGDLNLSGVTLTGVSFDHFDIDVTGLGNVVGAGESTTFTVTFAPENGGLGKTATVTIGSDDADEADYDVAVTASTTPNTWRQIIPATSPPNRFNAPMAAQSGNDLLLYGGRLADGSSDGTTWSFDVAAGDWASVATAASPGVRFSHGLGALAGGDVVLFGGTPSSGKGGAPQNDTWLFDDSAGNWIEQMPPASPPVRHQHGMVGGAGAAAIFGGLSNAGGPFTALADLWVYNAAANTWSSVPLVNGPVGTMNMAMASNAAGLVTLSGGNTFSQAGEIDQTWTFDPMTLVITPTASVTTPGARDGHRMAYLSGGLAVIFSGRQNPKGVFLVDGTWGYDPVADSWTDLAPAAAPPSRFGYSMAAVGENKLILFGGNVSNGAGGALGDTWEYVGPTP